MGHRIRSRVCAGVSAGTCHLLRHGPARGPGERRTKAVPAPCSRVTSEADRRPRVLDTGRDHVRPHVRSKPLAPTVQVLDAAVRGVPARQLPERAPRVPGAVVTYAIPPTTTVPIRGAAPSSPAS